MRKRYYWTPTAAGQRWPDASMGFGQGGLQPFNWVKIDNRGSNPVLVGLNSQPQNDQMDFYAQVSGGKVRVFNVAGPHDDASSGDSFPRHLDLVAITGGTTVMIEISDKPIIDFIFTI